MIAYQFTAALIGLSIGGLILWLVRKNHLHGPYAIWWILVAMGVILLGLFPQSVNPVAQWLGVSYPPILVNVLALAALLVKVLTMDLERTRQEVMLRRLAQRLAMLEGSPASNDRVADNEP
jgi:hypothetical protein